MRAIVLFVVGVVVAAVLAAMPTLGQKAEAATFDPGHIIDDAVFYNSTTMTESQIRSFINSKVPTCSSGYTCLDEYRENTTGRSADSYCKSLAGGKNEDAARIIYKVSRACDINPQVILVTLQKEQGLLTHHWPSEWRYTIAMGFGCPDGADCNSKYFGFQNQLYLGARQFQIYREWPNSFNYRAGQYNTIKWHPNSSCGTSRVYIENQATAGLYNYTPYRPNQAALNAGYGTGNSCSSYGNRNFFLYFNDWFGSTYGGSGATYISKAYAAAGGETGFLGAPVTNVNFESANGGGYVRGYENGAIAWSDRRGAFILTGEMRDAFSKYGGLSGELGWPESNENSVASNGGGKVQGFQGGAITISQTSVATIQGTVRSAYSDLHGLSGPLGWPTDDANCDSKVCVQEFERGTLTVGGNVVKFSNPALRTFLKSNPSLGSAVSAPTAFLENGGGLVFAHKASAVTWSVKEGVASVSGGVRKTLSSAGGVTSYIGWPTESQQCDSKMYCQQKFQGATISWSPSTGGQAVANAISEYHAKLGGASAFLGRPLGNTNDFAANGGGLVQGYEHGAITWSKAQGAASITGQIRAEYGEHGGISGKLGWPTGEPNAYTGNGGGKVQGFQNGAIAWSKQGGAHILSGGVRAAYSQHGGVSGDLGWPISGPNQTSASGSGVVQAFQHGAITANSSAGTHVISGEIRDLFGTLGGLSGSFGWPTTSASSPNQDGRLVQGFQGGAMVWTKSNGAVYITGAIRAFYSSQGGIDGVLGWPAANPVCSADGKSCSQKFDNGYIDWSLSGGAKTRV